MISKNDVVLLLTELEDRGINIGDNIVKVLKSSTIPLSTLKFINDNRQLDLTAFYEKLRKSYNHKRSKLYISILQDVSDPSSVPATLASYALQALLFSEKVEDAQMFLRHARVKEANVVLAKYLSDFDLSRCLELLTLIRADLMACEVVAGRREALQDA